MRLSDEHHFEHGPDWSVPLFERAVPVNPIDPEPTPTNTLRLSWRNVQVWWGDRPWRQR